MNPRSYQKTAIDSVLSDWQSVKSTLVVIPVGGGKTHVIAGVIAGVRPGRSIVIAHREELIYQARDKIESVTGLDCDIEKAELVASTNMFNRSDVIVATVQTLVSGGEKKRMTRFNPMHFSALIIDEAHHATSASYKEIITYFTEGNPDLKVLGVTATPDRSDEKALGEVFDTVAFDYEILDAIHDGWLVPIEQQMVTIEGLDFSSINTVAGDLNGAQLAAVMEAEKNMQGVAGATIDIVGNKRTLVFTASVKQAENICEIFNRYKQGMASWVCGATPKEERRKILEDFQSGAIQIVCNVGVLTEGYNNPAVECIVMARPTKSRALYAQCVGRAMRPLDGTVDVEGWTADDRKAAIKASAKTSCLVVDFAGNSGRHKLMSTADILGGKVSDLAMERALKRVKESQTAMPMSDILDEEQQKIHEEVKRRILAEQARKAKLVAKVTFSKSKIDPFSVLEMAPVQSRGWDAGKVLSEKQAQLLLQQGIDPSGMPYEQSRQILNEMFRRWGAKLCTLNQAALLQKHGYKDTKDMTMKHASTLIDALAKNGWKRPDLNGVKENE